MLRLTRRGAALAALLLCAAFVSTPAQKAATQANAIIAGRVTIDGKPAVGVVVVLTPAEPSPNRRSAGRATTDAGGNFRLTRVAAGRYNVAPFTPALVAPREGTYGQMGKSLTVAAGETIDGVDFALARGAVITGRVTDADGNPVVGEFIQLRPADRNARVRMPYDTPQMYETDDRGVYRLYGLPPGRYTVSVGTSAQADAERDSFSFNRSSYYARTFHPDAIDEARAKVIEVTEGGEATGVDITLNRRLESFAAAGRVVDAETNQPVPNTSVGVSVVRQGGRATREFNLGALSDARGRFRIEGLLPGRYAAFATERGEGETYSDPVSFEISGGDVSGLEVKMRRGASLSGTVVIEGTADKRILARLSQLTLGAVVEAGEAAPRNFVRAQIAPGGSFRIGGLRPGKARLFITGFQTESQLTLARVELNGVEQTEGIEIPRGGREIEGVRVVVEYGSGSVRGQVKIEGGTLPDGARLFVTARRLGRDDRRWQAPLRVDVDLRRRFHLENLPGGEYELQLQTYIPSASPPHASPVKQRISVTNGAESEVTLVLDLNAPEGGSRGNDDN